MNQTFTHKFRIVKCSCPNRKNTLGHICNNLPNVIYWNCIRIPIGSNLCMLQRLHLYCSYLFVLFYVDLAILFALVCVVFNLNPTMLHKPFFSSCELPLWIRNNLLHYSAMRLNEFKWNELCGLFANCLKWMSHAVIFIHHLCFIWCMYMHNLLFHFQEKSVRIWLHIVLHGG